MTITQFVTMIDHNYSFINGSMILNPYKIAPIDIGNNVWIGKKASILKVVKIGDNIIIGTNSLMTRDVPDNCLTAGNPKKILRIVNGENE